MIDTVSDTAIWVAYYRALETERQDALFHDSMARKLIGERGAAIDKQAHSLSKITQFHVVIRTVVIDQFIADLVSNGADTILNLGAGLDTRPYRLDLPPHVKWIEVDYPHVIDFKNKMLANEQPKNKIERVPLDLANRNERKKLFAGVGASSQNVLVLTEGVLGYLTETDVSELAADLHAEANFKSWIAEYQSPLAYRLMRNSAHNKHMKNALFRFMPKNWFEFFERQKWKKQAVAYLPEEADRLGRPVPQPLWARLVVPRLPAVFKKKVREITGYAVYKPVR